MKKTNLTSGSNYVQSVLIPSNAQGITDGIYLPSGIKEVITYSATNIQSNDYYTWDISDSIIPRTFYLQDNNLQTSREIDWRVFYSRSRLQFRQIIKIGEFTEFEYGYFFNFPTLQPIEVPEDGATSVQVQMKSNVSLDAISIFCEPCRIRTENNRLPQVLSGWLA